MDMQFEDLVLDNGQLVRLEIPTKHYDETLDDIDNARARGDWWSPIYEGVTATYLGHRVGRLDMKRVMGMM